MSPATKKRSNSAVRSDLSNNDQRLNDTHSSSVTKNSFVPIKSPTNESSANRSSTVKNHSHTSRPKLIQYIDKNIIGKDHTFQGPWGLRRSKFF